MSRIRTPENIEIASLKKKQAIHVDPMGAGPGTPWEDRGTHGPLGAFFKTVIMSLTSPGQLMNAIRRPETSNDAFGFLIGCGVCWGLSALIHGLIWMHGYSNLPNIDFDSHTYIIDCVIAMVAAGVGTWLLFLLYNLIYGKLVAQEKSQTKLPGVLLYNVNAYAFGPSLLAIIPIVGPAIAILWISADLVIAGTSRLQLRFAAAVIDALISLVVTLAVAFAGYWVGTMILNQVLGPPMTPTVPVAGRVTHQ